MSENKKCKFAIKSELAFLFWCISRFPKWGGIGIIYSDLGSQVKSHSNFLNIRLSTAESRTLECT